MSNAASPLPNARQPRLSEALTWIRRAADRVALSWFALAMAIVTLGGFAASLAPLALKTLIDRLVPGPGADGGLTSAGSALPLGLVAYVGALLLQRFCEQFQALAYGVGEQRLVRRLNNQAFAHLLALPLPFHLDGKSGGLTQSLAEGVSGARLVLTHLVLSILPIVVQILVAGGVLVGVFGGVLGLGLLAALTVYGAVFALGLGRIRKVLRGLSAAQTEVGGATADGLMNVEAVKAYGAEPRLTRRHDALLSVAERRWRGFMRRRLENGLAVAMVFAILLTTELTIAGLAVERGAMSVGAFVMVNTYLLQLIRPAEALGFAVRDIGQGLASLERLLSILARPVELKGPRALDVIDFAKPAHAADLEFDDVRFAYGAQPILDGVSFRAAPGARIAIVGSSGAGKSSLLRLALRFFEPTSGQIRLDGQPLSALSLEVVRRQIALVSQDTILLNDTIAENIGLAQEDADRDAILAAAHTARLGPLLARLPDGLDTPVGERGLKLSGGEKQRVAIARAALRSARLVIFDEATAALDPETERGVLEAMIGLSRQATCLIVTHRLSALSSVDEILVLDHGKIAERGDHAALLATDGIYARLWRAQGAAEIAGVGLVQGEAEPMTQGHP